MRKFKDQNMHFNRYQERVIEAGLEKSAKLVLPEGSDPRVSLAKRQLSDLGYELLEPQILKAGKTNIAKNWNRNISSKNCLMIQKINS